MLGPVVLGFDTSGPYLAVAVLNGDTCLYEHQRDLPRGQDQHLVDFLDEALAKSRKSWADLDGLAVGIGPGNFTGIRISVATARGLAQGLGIPAIGVSTFDAMRFGQPGVGYVTVAAPRGQIYFDAGDLCQDGLNLSPRLLAEGDDPGPLISARAKPYYMHFGEERAGWSKRLACDHLPKPKYPLAESIARFGAAKLEHEYTSPTPLYIKPADAAPPKVAAPTITP